LNFNGSIFEGRDEAGTMGVPTAFVSNPCHSFLFVPGNRKERFNKALASGAHVVIIDLEDAVPIEDKETARETVSSWLSSEVQVLVRVNAIGSQWFEADMSLADRAGVAGIVLPKAESAEDIALVKESCKLNKPIFPIIESAVGMWNALEIARAPAVQRIVFGTLDFILDMGIDEEGTSLNFYRSHLALASKVAGIQSPVDGVTTSVDDAALISEAAFNGKKLGLGGKLCIHPKQVASVNQCFAATAEQVAWALKVVKAAERARGGAVMLDGRMIDRPVIVRAMNLIGTRSSGL
jgi:citrate lyase subunit beta/citryl-CoA lyase